jgi:hypothetical protein
MLGASATAVGFVAGFGELIGYAVRLASGYLSDRTGRYCAVTTFGYCVNLLAVPLLALAGSWEAAAVLIVLERMGRAIRTPAQDAMLPHAAGAYWARLGLRPARGAGSDRRRARAARARCLLYFGGDYRTGFAVLLIPALLALALLLAARLLYPRPPDFELSGPSLDRGGLPRSLWVYLAAVALIAAGYADFPLIAYHFGRAEVIAPAWIPVLYALAMATDALAALVLGRLYDRIGLATMIVATAGSLLAVPLAFLGGATAALVGMALWGLEWARRNRSCARQSRGSRRQSAGARRMASSTRSMAPPGLLAACSSAPSTTARSRRWSSHRWRCRPPHCRSCCGWSARIVGEGQLETRKRRPDLPPGATANLLGEASVWRRGPILLQVPSPAEHES